MFLSATLWRSKVQNFIENSLKFVLKISIPHFLLLQGSAGIEWI